MSEITFALGAAIGCAVLFWTGYWFGGRSLRRRFTMLSNAIEESNKIYKEWEETSSGSHWMEGFKAGVSTTLNTLQAFIDKSVEEPDDPTQH